MPKRLANAADKRNNAMKNRVLYVSERMNNVDGGWLTTTLMADKLRKRRKRMYDSSRGRLCRKRGPSIQNSNEKTGRGERED